MTTASDLISVTDTNAQAGSIVWWRLRGGLVLPELAKAWATQHLPNDWLPRTPSLAVAFQRAVMSQREANLLVRSTKDGWAIVREEKTYDAEARADLAYETVLRVSLDKVGRLQFDKQNGRAEDIILAFEKYQHELIGADVSTWLSNLVEEHDAVPLRDTGGVYFVPRYALASWNRVVDAIRASSEHVVSNVPAMSSAEALRAIQDALAQDAARELEAMEKELDDDTLGERGLGNRLAATRTLTEKLGQYESILGIAQTTIRDRIEALRANITRAVFTLEAKKEAEQKQAASS